MRGLLRVPIAAIVFGALLMCFLMTLRRWYPILWAGIGVVIIAMSRILGLGIHPLISVALYLLLTITVGIIVLLKQVGREIPIC